MSISIGEGLRMMQGGVDRTGFADMADSLGNPGMDLIAARRAAVAEAEAMDEYEKRQAERDAAFLDDLNKLMGVQGEEKDGKFGDEFQSISGTDAALGILDPIGTALGIAGSAFEPMTDEEIDDFYKGPAQDQLYGGYGFDKFKDTYDLEKGDTNIFGNEVLMDSPMLVDPELRSLYEGAAGFEDGGRVGAFSGGIMNNLLGSPQIQSMIQQYTQPTFDFSQVASPSIPQPAVAPATPPQAYTPFVSTMPLYDPSTLGTGLPSTAGMTDPYFVYDQYSPVGAFDAPPPSTGPTPLTQDKIMETFKNLDKFDLAKQEAKRKAAEAAAKAEAEKKKPHQGGGGGGGQGGGGGGGGN